MSWQCWVQRETQNFCTELEEDELMCLPSFSLVEDPCNNSNCCHDNHQGDDDTSCCPTSTCSFSTFTRDTVTMAGGGGLSWRRLTVREIQLLDASSLINLIFDYWVRVMSLWCTCTIMWLTIDILSVYTAGSSSNGDHPPSEQHSGAWPIGLVRPCERSCDSSVPHEWITWWVMWVAW